jgi:hypothetical protein
MPKAKLVTRTSSTTSVTTDNIPKGSGLTNAELDSNFLNLRDQGFRIRADDSTQHTVTADTQVTFTGATVTSSGGDLTVATGGSGTETVTALTSASSITVDRNNGSVFTVTLAHNATFTLSNFGTGQTINIKITQDGTGGRTATFSGVKFAFGDSTIANGANAISFVTIFNDGTDKLAAVNRSYA